MNDNVMKKSVRGAERLLSWLGWAVFVAPTTATVWLAMFILDGPAWLLLDGPAWLGFKLRQLHEWAHTVNGQK